MKQEKLKKHFADISAIFNRQLFFVVGAPKSGTTWLQHILDNHPEVICSGEGHFLDALGKHLSDAANNYDKQIEYINKAVYGDEGYYSPINNGQFRFLLACYSAMMLFERFEKKPKAKAIGDKTPKNVLCLNEIDVFFPDAKIIHIVRDGRDVVVSRIKHGERLFKSRPEKTTEKSTIDDRTEEFAEEWSNCVSKAAEFAALHPNKILNVKYEELAG